MHKAVNSVREGLLNANLLKTFLWWPRSNTSRVNDSFPIRLHGARLASAGQNVSLRLHSLKCSLSDASASSRTPSERKFGERKFEPCPARQIRHGLIWLCAICSRLVLDAVAQNLRFEPP